MTPSLSHLPIFLLPYTFLSLGLHENAVVTILWRCSSVYFSNIFPLNENKILVLYLYRHFLFCYFTTTLHRPQRFHQSSPYSPPVLNLHSPSFNVIIILALTELYTTSILFPFQPTFLRSRNIYFETHLLFC
jgi:hypothetical protein